MSEKIDFLLNQLTVEEKVSLCSGFGPWSTKKIERLGVDPVFMSDGPHGPRWMKTQSYTQRAQWDMSSLASFTTKSGYLDLLHPVTNFPSLTTLASTWDREILYEVGKAIGEECRELGVGLLLAPGVNIIRHPLCGRAYEYISEDPVVAGELGSAYIRGVQSTGVGATVKHYVCNNAEFERLTMDSIVEERALREIYLAVFKRIVKKGNPAMVMESYNKVNGVSLAENKRLLTDILKKEWGYKGVIISDWWAVNDRIQSFNAGLDLEMPQNPLNDELLLRAVKDGEVSLQQLDDSCRRILELALKYSNLEKTQADYREHHQVARKAAGEAAVLLKNQEALPLQKDANIAILGLFAKKPRYQGVGCSIVNPRNLLTPLNEIKRKTGNVIYAQGYDEENNTSNILLEEARQAACKSECVLIFVGLPEEVETETHDREDYSIPKSHIRLIEKIAKLDIPIVVILQNGSAVETKSWMNSVSAIVESWLGGEAGAGALADILFGEVNPSGKLAITFPERIEDTPGYLNFPGENGRHIYQEGIYVGYRYYEKKLISPAFPFGFGLSYTKFEYKDMELDKKSITNEDTLKVSFTIRNVGGRAGREIAQLYVKPWNPRLKRPVKELKNFTKASLESGEEKRIELILTGEDFAYYDDHHKEWVTDSGKYIIQIGSSSADIRLEEDIFINSKQIIYTPLTGESYCYNLVNNPYALEAFKQVMTKNEIWPEKITEEFIEKIRHNFIPLFKSVTRQTGGEISRETFDSWMDEVNKKTKESMRQAYN